MKACTFAAVNLEDENAPSIPDYFSGFHSNQQKHWQAMKTVILLRAAVANVISEI